MLPSKEERLSADIERAARRIIREGQPASFTVIGSDDPVAHVAAIQARVRELEAANGGD